MEVVFWGVRGSIPSPPTSEDLKNKISRVLELAASHDISTAEKRDAFLSTLTYRELGFLGGNTPCVELRVKDKIFIFDMGTGIRELGEYLMKSGQSKSGLDLHIFIGHTHWDHIQGFPFFIPAYRPNTNIHFYFSHPQVKERLEFQQDYRFFPVSLEFMAAKKHFHLLDPTAPLNIDGIIVKTMELNHPGKAFCYRIESEGKSFVYASDGEYNNLPNSKINSYINFYRGTDFLIYDAPYSFTEEMEKINWGHSSAVVGVDLCVKAEVKKIALFHHAPENNDEAVFNLLDAAVNYKKQNYSTSELEIVLAREGVIFPV
ncbi:MAG: MBL fold metallo-hydrolase [Ignavibacteriales bacterium]|nr:MBL fold metallo-hydrolase [Ignavibacteriales bacterium]